MPLAKTGLKYVEARSHGFVLNKLHGYPSPPIRTLHLTAEEFQVTSVTPMSPVQGGTKRHISVQGDWG